MSDNEDGGRTKRVTFYVSESEQNALKREAEERDKSLSAYCLQLVRRQRQLDAEDQLAEDLNVEQCLEEITQQAIDRIDFLREAVGTSFERYTRNTGSDRTPGESEEKEEYQFTKGDLRNFDPVEARDHPPGQRLGSLPDQDARVGYRPVD